MDEVVRLTETLVRTPSHEDESAVGDIIEEWLERHTDATVRRDEVGNVIAHRGTGEETTALVGHHDVVPPGDGQVDDDGSMLVRIEDGRLYGRGAADMKGAVAAMMLAFRDAEPAGRVAFASFIGEEVGGVGARHAVEQGFVPDRAVIGEGSAGYQTRDALDVVTLHRGRRGSTLVAEGVACHASEPEAGVNAIYRAIDAIHRLRRLERPSITVHGEEVQATLEVTNIDAGTAMNVIPDRCTVTLDERTLPGESMPVERCIDSIEGVSWIVDQDWPSMRCSDDAFAEGVRRALSNVQGRKVSFAPKPHATDASWLAKEGSATVVVGPAERGEAHTDAESVGIDLLSAAMEGYRAVLETPFE